MTEAPGPLRGYCHATYGFELGQDIDLVRCEQLLAPSVRQTIRSRGRVPHYFEYKPAPLRIPQDPPAFDVAGLDVSRVDVVLYDFGAASVNFTMPWSGDLAGLVPISAALQDTSILADNARERLQRLLHTIGAAIDRPRLANLVEDYLVFELEQHEGTDARAFHVGPERVSVARILRGAPEPLSPEEEEDALRLRLSFGTTDLTIVDWNAALLYDPEPEETRELLEFANVQLLELRHLDEELDQVVDQAYDAIADAERGGLRMLRPPTAPLRQVGELQINSAVLYERVSSAVKLVGDRFLGRVYLAASERFHFADWDQGITRKLAVTEGIYQKLADRTTARRLEVLEWIVILLIGFEIVFSLIDRARS